MPQLLNPGNLATLGWSLLNSIWQMGLLWVLYLLLTGNHKRFSSALRHNLALFFSGLGFIWVLCSLIVSLAHPEGPVGWPPASFISSRISVVIAPCLSVLTMLYLVILTWWTGRYVLGFYQLQTNKRYAETIFSEPLQLFSDKVSRIMGIRKPVGIQLVNWVDTAQTIGFLKPLVLLPAALLSRLTMEQVETIILHELLHIRRNDYLINILMTVFQALFFFNPFACFFFKTVAREREQACDDGVLLWNYPAPVYAEALFILEKFRQKTHAISLAANGNNPRLLIERIRRVTGLPISGRKTFSSLSFFSLIAALFIFALNSFSRFPGTDTEIQPRPSHLTIQPPGLISQTGTVYLSVLEETTINKTAGSGTVQKQSIRIVEKKKPVNLLIESASGATKKTVLPKDEETQRQLALADQFQIAERLQYADHGIIRNYSNQKATEVQLPRVLDLEGAPFVPPSNFLYSPATDTLMPEDVLLQNKLKAMITFGKIKIVEVQSKLNEEISRKLKEIERMKKENRKLIEQNRKNLEPAILKIKEDIQHKRQEIDHLMMQVQIDGGEIIVI